MTIYQVTYRTRLEGWEESVHILADSSYEAYKKVSEFVGRPVPLKVTTTNEADYAK